MQRIIKLSPQSFDLLAVHLLRVLSNCKLALRMTFLITRWDFPEVIATVISTQGIVIWVNKLRFHAKSLDTEIVSDNGFRVRPTLLII